MDLIQDSTSRTKVKCSWAANRGGDSKVQIALFADAQSERTMQVKPEKVEEHFFLEF